MGWHKAVCELEPLPCLGSLPLRAGQMDYAQLTMAEIKVVKQSFVFSLTNMLHGRIPEPKDNENKHPNPTEKPSDSDSEA